MRINSMNAFGCQTNITQVKHYDSRGSEKLNVRSCSSKICNLSLFNVVQIFFYNNKNNNKNIMFCWLVRWLSWCMKKGNNNKKEEKKRK